MKQPWQKNQGANLPASVGYWGGGILCFIGILALSFGIAPFIQSLRKSFIPLSIPGSQTLRLKIPGSYLAVYPSKGAAPEILKRVSELQFSLAKKKGEEPVPILKIPAKVYATDRMEAHTPLFQFVVDQAGSYLLNSSYPYDLEGPKIQAFLIHTDLGYVRMELIVGVLLFFVLGALGLIIIRKTYKSHTIKKTGEI